MTPLLVASYRPNGPTFAAPKDWSDTILSEGSNSVSRERQSINPKTASEEFLKSGNALVMGPEPLSPEGGVPARERNAAFRRQRRRTTPTDPRDSGKQ